MTPILGLYVIHSLSKVISCTGTGGQAKAGFAPTCRAFGLWPSPTGPAVGGIQSPLGSPGFRTKSLRIYSGSLPLRVLIATHVSAIRRIAFRVTRSVARIR